MRVSTSISEFLFGDLVDHVLEDLLVSVTDEFILICALGFMSPESNEEELGWHLLLKLGACGEYFPVISVSNASNTLEKTCQITNVEFVMELGGCGQETFGDGLTEDDGGINEERFHVDDVLSLLTSVLLGSDNGIQDSTVDVLDGTDRGRCHVHVEEVTHHSGGDAVSTTDGLTHSGGVLQLLEGLEGSCFIGVEGVETTHLDTHSGDFEGWLITPSVDFGHGEIIHEDEHLFVSDGSLDTSLELNEFSLERVLEVDGEGGTGEIDSLERVGFAIEGVSVHENARSLGGTGTSDEEGVLKTEFLTVGLSLGVERSNVSHNVFSTS